MNIQYDKAKATQNQSRPPSPKPQFHLWHHWYQEQRQNLFQKTYRPPLGTGGASWSATLSPDVMILQRSTRMHSLLLEYVLYRYRYRSQNRN